MSKKSTVGIMTFHNSYNCGSMLESYAIQEILKKGGLDAKIINFSSKGQIELYSSWKKANSIKNILKNILLIPAHKRILNNNLMYESFKNKYFNLTSFTSNPCSISDLGFDTIIAGSDQIWNITIKDYDKAYFLPWVKSARKVAYAPSFGAKNIMKYSDNLDEFKNYLLDFDALSIREKNGQKWIFDLIGKKVQIVLDPTLLLSSEDYEKLVAQDINISGDYIFFYSPGFDSKVCKFVKKVSKKYNIPVITWSTSPYYIKLVGRFGFKLAPYENPSAYLYLIKNAKLIFTTSYHGTIFSTIFKKTFFTIKNGEMFSDDDRVKTLLEQLSMEERLIDYDYDSDKDYLKDISYDEYDKKLVKLKNESTKYLEENVIGYEYETSK